jgi:hypothetical protein
MVLLFLVGAKTDKTSDKTVFTVTAPVLGAAGPGRHRDWISLRLGGRRLPSQCTDHH